MCFLQDDLTILCGPGIRAWTSRPTGPVLRQAVSGNLRGCCPHSLPSIPYLIIHLSMMSGSIWKGEHLLGFPDRNQDGPACSLTREAYLERKSLYMSGGHTAGTCFSVAGNHMFLHHSSPPPPLKSKSFDCVSSCRLMDNKP